MHYGLHPTAAGARVRDVVCTPSHPSISWTHTRRPARPRDLERTDRGRACSHCVRVASLWRLPSMHSLQAYMSAGRHEAWPHIDGHTASPGSQEGTVRSSSDHEGCGHLPSACAALDRSGVPVILPGPAAMRVPAALTRRETKMA